MSQGEIITLQLGHFANFVGTHWWNIQELGFRSQQGDSACSGGYDDINHDRLFHTGMTVQVRKERPLQRNKKAKEQEWKH